MLRPEIDKKVGILKLHLREIQCCQVDNPWLNEFWLFGNTEDKQSVAVKILDFHPYFFVERANKDANELMDDINEELCPYPRYYDDANNVNFVTNVEQCEKVPSVGFTNSTPTQLWKITYSNARHLYKLKKYFSENTFSKDGKHQKLKLYHEDWNIEDLFLHEMDLKMQTWISIDKFKFPSVKHTTCGIEVHVSIRGQKIHTAISECLIPPILICSLRIRAVSVHSTIDNLMQPNPTDDPITLIGVQMYWMGSDDDVVERIYKGDEKSILTNFFNDINVQDIDCFSILTDNCNPLLYIAKRATVCDVAPQLSKFRIDKVLASAKSDTHREKLSPGCEIGYFDKVGHCGRSRMNIKEALKKMFVKPKLEGFTIKDASFHPSITKEKHVDDLESFTFLCTKFLHHDTVEYQLKEELKILTSIDKSNNLLLGFVELSLACYGVLTAMVENGQQIRVWHKFMSKMYEFNLLANKQQLRQAPVVLKKPKSESSFPDPPELANISFSRKNKRKAQDMKQYNILGEEIISKKAKKVSKKKWTGGFVCNPETGFYNKVEEATFTFDFASLYPSIIEGYNVCYMRVLYDKKMLQDPRFEFEYVPLNDNECLVLVHRSEGKLVQTFLPQTTSEVVLERKAVRKKQKTIGITQFEYQSLEAKQLACKVFQNALYGFLGVEKHSIFACPVLMATVCAIGQFMIKTTKHVLMRDHKGYNVYG